MIHGGKMSLRILVADDHKLFRQGLISLMKAHEESVEVVGEAATGSDTVRLTEQLRPDVVLMDIFMPDGDGLEATREITARFPETPVVMLTSSEDDEHLFEAVRLGASGYLLKNLDADELFNLLRGVTRGEAAMTRAMASRVLKGFAKRGDGDKGDDLTEREVMVLRLVAEGASNAQIAEALCITVNTVKFHLKNILAKLRLENRTQAATYAVRSGLAEAN